MMQLRNMVAKLGDDLFEIKHVLCVNVFNSQMLSGFGQAGVARDVEMGSGK